MKESCRVCGAELSEDTFYYVGDKKIYRCPKCGSGTAFQNSSYIGLRKKK